MIFTLSTKLTAGEIKQALLSLAPDVLARFPVLFAYLYGSYAAESAHPFSDVDIAVFLFADTVERVERIESDIALELDEALGHRIEMDVRAINNAPLVLQGEILREGMLLYASDDVSRVEFETRVRMAYFDFLPALAAYRDTYIENALSV